MAAASRYADDALLAMLFPFWQLVIGACVLLALVLSVRKLVERGPSRMGRAMVVSGAVVIGLATIGFLVDAYFSG